MKMKTKKLILNILQTLTITTASIGMIIIIYSLVT